MFEKSRFSSSSSLQYKPSQKQKWMIPNLNELTKGGQEENLGRHFERAGNFSFRIPEKMKSENFVGVLIETIEVFISQILYFRNAYPQQIFKKRRFYNAPVYASIFPPLNTYLHNVLRTAKELLCGNNIGELQCIEVIFYVDENSIIERHILEFSNSFQTQNTTADEFLLDFEEQLRKSLYEIPKHMKPFNKLPNEALMKIQLHTTQSGHTRLNTNAHFQDFPWLQIKQQCTTGTSNEWNVFPLTTLPELGLKLLTEVY